MNVIIYIFFYVCENKNWFVELVLRYRCVILSENTLTELKFTKDKIKIRKFEFTKVEQR